MMNPPPLSACLLLILSPFFFTINSTHATQIDVVNNCGYPVWAAAWAPPNGFGGGKALPNKGDTWTLTPPPGTSQARIWARTGCTFDASGNGHCNTGDCGGVLECKSYGSDPQTLAEFTLKQPNPNPDDTIDISLVEGFNVPMSFSPVNPTGGTCRAVSCTADIVAQCPDQLKALGGCNNPCTVFNTVKYCCTQERGSCGPTPFSQFFKTRCPDAYSYPQDDQTSTFACPSGTNYRVTFCP